MPRLASGGPTALYYGELLPPSYPLPVGCRSDQNVWVVGTKHGDNGRLTADLGGLELLVLSSVLRLACLGM